MHVFNSLQNRLTPATTRLCAVVIYIKQRLLHYKQTLVFAANFQCSLIVQIFRLTQICNGLEIIRGPTKLMICACGGVTSQ